VALLSFPRAGVGMPFRRASVTATHGTLARPHWVPTPARGNQRKTFVVGDLSPIVTKIGDKSPTTNLLFLEKVMRLINTLIFLIVTSLPLTGWGANIRYVLDVTVEPQNQKLTGVARVKGNRTMHLNVENLSKLTVDNQLVSVDQGHITVEGDQEVRYEAVLRQVDQDNVFLTGNWYPQPDGLAEYALSVTLPSGFIATSEAESVEIQETEAASIFTFQFNHPLDSLNLAASKNYVLKTDTYNNISIEAYFFKEDAHLADTYIEYTKKYLAMYEAMLTPYPYQRFAIVENIFPTGLGMPTYTLLGRAVVRLPFIVKTSLGHEILHEWFGNSVFVDYEKGNWAEGITNYLADQHYAALSGKGAAYRKQIMVDYNAYVNENNAMPIRAFKARHNKAERAIGYGKTAMIFHQLRMRYGDEIFFTALRHFINNNSFRAATWQDIQDSFEKLTGDNLGAYFTQWLERENIPHFSAEEVELLVAQGKLTLSFTLVQHTTPYSMQLPITIETAAGKTQRLIDVSREKEKITLILDEPPTKVVIDENYDVMRQLLPEEIPPTLGAVMGKENMIVVMSPEQSELYQPLVDALGVTSTAQQDVKFTQLKDNSLIIAGFDTPMVEMLFGKQVVPEDGVRVVVHKNPYNENEVIALLHAKNANEVKAVARRLSHYGKYSVLAFSGGRNSQKAITESSKGISLLSRSATRVLKPDNVVTLDDILPIDSRVIYVGEQHDQFSHHINQLMVIKKLHEAGHKIAVGMEMFQVPYQKALDDYMAGLLSERRFLKDSDYFSNWRFDYNLYKPIIDYVKTAGIPLIALNIDKDITGKVAREGIHSLTAEERQHLPSEMDLSNESYRDDLYQVFLIHQRHQGHQDFEYFLQTQVLWDETMAQTAHQFLADNPDTKLIVLAGNGHVRYRYGIPNRLYRRNGEPFTVIVQDEKMDEGIGDYVLLTEEIKGKQSPKIGIGIEEKDKQLVIMSVGDNTPAKKAGLQAGDIITRLGERKIEGLVDLKWVLFYTEMGSRVTIEVMRDGETISLDLTLFEFGRHH
jgi:uncharacterized iron-regulated protein